MSLHAFEGSNLQSCNKCHAAYDCLKKAHIDANRCTDATNCRHRKMPCSALKLCGSHLHFCVDSFLGNLLHLLQPLISQVVRLGACLLCLILGAWPSYRL